MARRCRQIAGLERVKGIEPSSSAWEAAALPLSYTRDGDLATFSAGRLQAQSAACCFCSCARRATIAVWPAPRLMPAMLPSYAPAIARAPPARWRPAPTARSFCARRPRMSPSSPAIRPARQTASSRSPPLGSDTGTATACPWICEGQRAARDADPRYGISLIVKARIGVLRRGRRRRARPWGIGRSGWRCGASP